MLDHWSKIRSLVIKIKIYCINTYGNSYIKVKTVKGLKNKLSDMIHTKKIKSHII